MSTNDQAWTAEDDLLILTKLKKGMSAKEQGLIVQRMKRTVHACQQRKSMIKGLADEARFQPEYKRLPQQVKHMIWLYRFRGFEPNEIAKVLDLDRTTIYGVIAEPLEWE